MGQVLVEFRRVFREGRDAVAAKGEDKDGRVLDGENCGGFTRVG
jgi:hypothetical protein